MRGVGRAGGREGGGEQAGMPARLGGGAGRVGRGGRRWKYARVRGRARKPREREAKSRRRTRPRDAVRHADVGAGAGGVAPRHGLLQRPAAHGVLETLGGRVNHAAPARRRPASLQRRAVEDGEGAAVGQRAGEQLDAHLCARRAPRVEGRVGWSVWACVGVWGRASETASTNLSPALPSPNPHPAPVNPPPLPLSLPSEPSQPSQPSPPNPPASLKSNNS